MSLKITTLLVAAILLSVIISCKKENKHQSTAFNSPLKGANGSLIYSGSAAPPATLGTAGDYYLNVASSTLYGPKTANSWGSGVSTTIVPNALGGGKTLSGSGAPGSTLGNVGDFYLDTSALLLYGPKTASGWGSPVSVASPASKSIYYSGWAYANNFRDSIIDNSAVKLATVAAPFLSQNYINSAGILIYFSFGAGAFPMPYTSYAGGKANVISFLPRVGQILITRFTLDNSNSIALSTLLQYRYVIVPAGQLVAAAQHNVNLNDQEAVKRYFHLPD